MKGKAVLMWSRVSCPVSASKKYMLPLMVAYMASTRPSFCLAQSRMFIMRLVDSGQRTSSGPVQPQPDQEPEPYIFCILPTVKVHGEVSNFFSVMFTVP